MIIVPGVGFDMAMNRIGHGKGYYDHFIRRCHEHAKKSGRDPPVLGTLTPLPPPSWCLLGVSAYLCVVALALKCQLVEEGRIPMTEMDWKMDVIIVDGEVLQQRESDR